MMLHMIDHQIELFLDAHLFTKGRDEVRRWLEEGRG
jgi:hypothetical protein